MCIAWERQSTQVDLTGFGHSGNESNSSAAANVSIAQDLGNVTQVVNDTSILQDLQGIGNSTNGTNSTKVQSTPDAGKMSGLRWYNRLLSQTDVARLAAAEPSALEAEIMKATSEAGGLSIDTRELDKPGSNNSNDSNVSLSISLY